MKAKYIFLLLLLANINVLWASNIKIDGIWYNLDKTSQVATVTYRGNDYTSYAEYRGSVIIPNVVKYQGVEYSVTNIGERAFSECTNLTSVTIPNSVLKIGNNAFENCIGLTSVSIGNSVTSIGQSAFSHCTSLTSLSLPSSVEKINVYAFFKCTNLTSVVLPNSITYLGALSFAHCTSLTTIIIPNSVNDINRVFMNCTNLTSVTIPNNITCIGDYAFFKCTNLTSITIPNSVLKIGESTFSHCDGLTSVNIPNSVTNIGKSAFSECTNLTSVSIGDGVISIGESAFLNCNNIKSVILGTSVQTIGKLAFYGCGNLISIELPNSVRTIEDNAFSNCSSLTTITIPNNVKSIGDKSFIGCAKLGKFYFPDGLNVSKAGIPTSAKLNSYNPKENQSYNSSALAPENPPLLTLIDKSQSFWDDNSNNRIDADEKCIITFKIENKGKGVAKNCEARIILSGTVSGISVQTVKLPTIAAGQIYEVNIPISSDINTHNGNVTFLVEVYEPNGWGVAPFDLTVATKAYEPPYLQVVDYNIASNSGKIQKMEPFTLTFNLQNTKYGDAEDVKVKVKLPNNVFVMDGNAELYYPLIQSGEVKSVQIALAANNNYYNNDIPITIEIKEKHGKFAENKQLDIALNQTTSSSINIAAKAEEKQERKEIQVAMIKSDVDRDIPITNVKNPNTFVLIIANEHYQQVAAVPYALNDGNVFREYCLKTLGISEKHIHYIPDATINHIKAQVNWLANITETWDDPQVIVYYAGHGIPDEASKSAYLLPVDGSGMDVTTGYKLDELYAMLGNMLASKITVFMDACFSGSKREEGMLASARGVALKAKSGVPQGKMVVFSAAQGDETAYPYREQQHGMFTYHLLKKLQETSGDVTLQELGNYIIREVKKRSLEENDKKQTPCVTPSAEVGTEWQNWKLK